MRYLLTSEWARDEEDALSRRARVALAIAPHGRSALAELIKANA